MRNLIISSVFFVSTLGVEIASHPPPREQSGICENVREDQGQGEWCDTYCQPTGGHYELVRDDDGELWEECSWADENDEIGACLFPIYTENWETGE